jgi:hypothetical protein
VETSRTERKWGVKGGGVRWKAGGGERAGEGGHYYLSNSFVTISKAKHDVCVCVCARARVCVCV